MKISKEQIEYILEQAPKIEYGEIRLIAMSNRDLADIEIKIRRRFDENE